MSSALALGWKLQLNPCGSAKAFSFGGDNLEGCVTALEGERRKIEAFKRELPLCMDIITEAIEALKLHLAEQQHNDASTASSLLKLSCSYRDEAIGHDSVTAKSDSVLEEFIPPKTLEESKRDEKACDPDLDKPSWMAQVQLWSEAKQIKTQKESPTRPQAKHAVPGIFANSGGAFSPFVRAAPSTEEKPGLRSTSDAGLTLSSSESSPRSGVVEETRPTVEKRTVEATTPAARSTTSSQFESNSQRKARRCWSPELHRRFLNALQQLGGSHVATPKQIREIMKVDGLTNDEVKSHLQKYRLHTRRPTVTTSQTSEPGGAQVVVVSGIWASEFAAAALQQSSTAAAFYRSPIVPQEAQPEPKATPAQEQHESESMAIDDEAKGCEHRKQKPVEQHDEEIDDGDVTENEDSKSEEVVTTANA
ncbi:transcription factor HHO2 [Selaginella moellendorffii]|uniref:transcription factor HHO2 n=1 Tax=Selaginella moellendorffii TaxID=88036 RepID=UPI000D1C9AB0|nr:transcription factor HHO2 [Selaginella moellendorffii]XP_024525904.1 transcription factor HHO2 [Selaginella moellendorffii]|eukprot:XP_024525903.1 transcription factor HHO2 [Selaginella moellendorffii]